MAGVDIQLHAHADAQRWLAGCIGDDGTLVTMPAKGAWTTECASWRAASSRAATASLYLGWLSIGASGSPFRLVASPASCCCSEASFCCEPWSVLRAAS